MLRYIICISFYLIAINSVLEYGEFDLVIKEYGHCKGPKRNDCVNGTITVVDGSSVRYDFYVNRDLRVIKGKLAGTLNDIELLRLQLKDICEHIFIKPIILSLFRTDRCGILKGHYSFTVDLQAMARKFYGGKFMYGNWTTKVLFYTDFCNIHCGNIYMSLVPRISKSSK